MLLFGYDVWFFFVCGWCLGCMGVVLLDCCEVFDMGKGCFLICDRSGCGFGGGWGCVVVVLVLCVLGGWFFCGFGIWVVSVVLDLFFCGGVVLDVLVSFGGCLFFGVFGFLFFSCIFFVFWI